MDHDARRSITLRHHPIFRVGIAPSAGNPSLSDFAASVAHETTVGLVGGASLNLPLSLQGGPLGTLSASVGDANRYLDGSPNAINVSAPNLAAALAGLLTPASMIQDRQDFLLPLNGLLNGLRATLTTQLSSEELPLVGNHLADATGFLASIQSAVLPLLASAIKQSTGDPIALVRQALLSGLRSVDPNATVGVRTLDGGNTLEFDIHASGTISEPLPFDLALPVTNFDLHGQELATYGWTLSLDVGVNTSTGFYVIASPHADPNNPASSIVPIIAETVSVTLPAASYPGILGFLNVTATNNPANTSGVTVPGGTDLAQVTGLLGTLDVTLNPPNSVADGRIPASLLSTASIASMTQAVLDGSAWVDMHLISSVGPGAMFPSLDLDVVMNWDLSGLTLGQGGLADKTPQVSYENVQVDLGSFVTTFVSPLLDKIKPILDDIHPIIAFLTTRLPVVSDLAGQDVTMASLAETLDPSHAIAIKGFLALYNLLYTLSNEVGDAGGGNLKIDLGSYDLNQLIGDPQGMTAASLIEIKTSLLPKKPDPGGQAEAKGASAHQAKFTKDITTSGGGLSLPILDDPLAVAKLLLGQPVDLFRLDSPTLTFSFDYSKEYPIYGPLFAVLDGNLSAQIQFSLGYDTQGMIEWAHSGFAPAQAVPDLDDGFYLVANGSPLLELNASISAGAKLDAGAASASLTGGIYAVVDFSLDDPTQTGKVRFLSFIHKLSHPLDIFDVSGSIYFQLLATLELGVGVATLSKTFHITDPITIVSFSYVPPSTPDLATQSQGGTLDLNTGPNSALRQNGNTNEADQTFNVSHAGGSAGNEVVAVSSQGQTTTYSGVRTITAGGGLGNDTIDMTGVQSDTVLTGGQGRNTIIGGSGHNTLVESQFSNYHLTAAGLTMDGSNSDRFRNIQTVDLTGPSGGHAVMLDDGYVGDVNMNGQGGNNQFGVVFSPDGLTTIRDNGGPGAPDTVTITLADGTDTFISATKLVQGVNTVDYGGDPNLSALIVNGLQPPTHYTITDTPPSPVTTTINTGDGDDIVDVLKTSGPTTIHAGAGNDLVNVGSLAAGPGGVLSTIQGGLTVDTVIGNVTLNLDDTGDSAARLGTLTDTTLNGLGLGPRGITFVGMTTLNLGLGTGVDHLTVTVQDDLPEFSNITSGNAADLLTLTYAHNLDGIVNFAGFAATTSPATIGGKLNGTLNLVQTPQVPLLSIGSISPGGIVTGINVGELDVAGNMSGQVTLSGTLTRGVIRGGTAGAFVANRVGTIATYAGYGPVVLQVREAGIERQVEAATPGNPYPTANPFTLPVPPVSPGQVTFMSMYEGLVSTDGAGASPAYPQISLRVIQPARVVAAQQYDLSFVSWSDTSKFNLGRLDVVGTGTGVANAGIRNVAVEGDLLPTIAPEVAAFLGLATNLGGIRLPLDKLTGVGVSGFVPQRYIQSASLQGVSYGSMKLDNGKVVEAIVTLPGQAGELLAASTGYAQAVTGTTFRVPFAVNHAVALYYVALANQHSFDVQDIAFVDQNLLDPTAGASRGGIDALVTTNLALAGPAVGSARRALIGSVAFNGDGAGLVTGQWITGSITSTGPLGDLTVANGQGLTANVTAPAVFGSIKSLSGPIAGTITTTGTRYDPVTGAASSVNSDIGRIYSGPGGTKLDTQVLAGPGGLTGRIVDAGKLISQVTSVGPIRGLIAAAGDIGVAVSGPGGTTTRFGGITSQGLVSGQVLTMGNVVGDLTFQGGLAGGQVEAAGSILGNVKLVGGFTSASSIVAGGTIGNASTGTGLTLTPGNAQGLVAAKGAVRFATATHPTVYYQNQAGPNASAIDALFAALNDDLTSLAMTRLQADPARLKASAGVLSFSRS